MRRKTRKGGGRQHEIRIDRLGGRGDGQGRAEDGSTLFVPYALPGEKLRVKAVGSSGTGAVCTILELIEPSPDRVEPPCPHFGRCGGCQLQHMETTAYQAWKYGRAQEAVKRAGFESVALDPMITPLTAPGPGADGPRNRRRARFALHRSHKEIEIGFRGRASRTLEPLSDCLVLAPEMRALLDALKPWLRQALEFGEEAQLNVNLTGGSSGWEPSGGKPSGEKPQADVCLITAGEPSDRALQAAGVLHALPAGLPVRLMRVTREYGRDYATPVLVHETPFHEIEGVKIPVPHDIFLQPSDEGERILTGLVLDSIPADGLRIADLFSGIGTFAIPLVCRKNAKVTAFEGFKYAVRALQKTKELPLYAAKLKNLSTGQRDLERWPLKPDVLNGFDVLVLDPPRAGARALCRSIGESKVPRLTYVSCNPATFTRDARILKEGGYGLKKLTPVDQFPWTGHLELVAVFEKNTA